MRSFPCRLYSCWWEWVRGDNRWMVLLFLLCFAVWFILSFLTSTIADAQNRRIMMYYCIWGKEHRIELLPRWTLAAVVQARVPSWLPFLPTISVCWQKTIEHVWTCCIPVWHIQTYWNPSRLGPRGSQRNRISIFSNGVAKAAGGQGQGRLRLKQSYLVKRPCSSAVPTNTGKTWAKTSIFQCATLPFDSSGF